MVCSPSTSGRIPESSNPSAQSRKPLRDILLGNFFGLPERVFQILPAAVLFATVFSIGGMSRHSELTAAKASGISMRRAVLPVLVAAVLATAAGLGLGEIAPPATRRQLELLGELQRRSQDTRSNFVYRADAGWVYVIHDLSTRRRQMSDVILEREGSGPEYPTLVVQARNVTYDDSTDAWTLREGRFLMVSGLSQVRDFGFGRMRLPALHETPAQLLVEPKKPQEMRYAELHRYIDALERSGGDGRLLRVELALKIAVPFTCLIITLFAAPLALSGGPRSSGAFGVALSITTAIIFLVLVQLSRTIGGGGLVPPTLAAWLPNILFGAMGVWMFRRAAT